MWGSVQKPTRNQGFNFLIQGELVLPEWVKKWHDIFRSKKPQDLSVLDSDLVSSFLDIDWRASSWHSEPASAEVWQGMMAGHIPQSTVTTWKNNKSGLLVSPFEKGTREILENGK